MDGAELSRSGGGASHSSCLILLSALITCTRLLLFLSASKDKKILLILSWQQQTNKQTDRQTTICNPSICTCRAAKTIIIKITIAITVLSSFRHFCVCRRFVPSRIEKSDALYFSAQQDWNERSFDTLTLCRFGHQSVTIVFFTLCDAQIQSIKPVLRNTKLFVSDVVVTTTQGLLMFVRSATMRGGLSPRCGLLLCCILVPTLLWRSHLSLRQTCCVWLQRYIIITALSVTTISSQGAIDFSSSY
jgi:hypothetical protein